MRHIPSDYTEVRFCYRYPVSLIVNQLTMKFLKQVLVACSVCMHVFAVNAAKPVYQQADAPIDARVADLMGRMTLHEKVMQLQNRSTGGIGEAANQFGGFSSGTMHDMYHNAEECQQIIADIQRYMKNETRLGIPVIPCVEGLQGILQNGCTLFPQAIAQGSTFNPELIERMTAASAKEARAMGITQVLSPVFDIARELRWGRVEECFSEDPFLIAEIGIGFMRGYQNNGVNCMPKHFVAHGTPTGGLNTASVSGGPRELEALYLYPFRRVIEATHPMAVMSCYSTYDGVPVTGSRHYMTDILRGKLGFDGYVYSDWGSVDRLKTFHYAAADTEEAARMALIAGIDVDIDSSYETLEKQVEEGLIDMAYIDTAVERVLRAKFNMGLFDNEIGSKEDVEKYVRSAEHVALAKQVADESAVLLTNNGVLPLDLGKFKRIAVVGPNANQTVFGDYNWTTNGTTEGVNLLQGMRNRVGDKAEILYAEGCDWWSQDDSKIAQAVEAVDSADVAIVAVGTRSIFLGRNPQLTTSGEGFDLSSLELPGRQTDLLKAVKATGKPMVVVLISGKPMVMNWANDNADAILLQWYAGEEQGNSAADILLGNVNPSGRLNVSFPRSTGNTPCFYNYYRTDREYGSDFGGSPEEPRHRYIFEKPYALWPFGHGLSYTDFAYGNLRVDKGADSVTVTVDVTNTGQHAGSDVMQVYVKDVVSSVATPVRQLKGFKKVNLEPGQTQSVAISIPLREFELVNAALEHVLEPGDFEIEVGRSSDNILFTHKLTL